MTTSTGDGRQKHFEQNFGNYTVLHAIMLHRMDPALEDIESFGSTTDRMMTCYAMIEVLLTFYHPDADKSVHTERLMHIDGCERCKKSLHHAVSKELSECCTPHRQSPRATIAHGCGELWRSMNSLDTAY